MRQKPIHQADVPDDPNYVIHTDVLTAEEMRDLRAFCGLSALEPILMETAIFNSFLTLSAVSAADKLCGMARVIGDGAFLFLLADVLVSPLHRKRGLGTRLVRQALEEIARRVPGGVWVTVSLFAAVRKEKFYEKLGFERLPGSRDGAGMRMFVQGKGMR